MESPSRIVVPPASQIKKLGWSRIAAPMAMKSTPRAIGPYRPARLSVMPLHIDIIGQAASELTSPKQVAERLSSVGIASTIFEPSDSITPPLDILQQDPCQSGRRSSLPTGAA
jgi:hypothetical protein